VLGAAVHAPKVTELTPVSDFSALPLGRRGTARQFRDGLLADNTVIGAQDLRYSQVQDVGARKVIFEDCDFSFSVLNRVYFRDGIFRRCKFMGCIFQNCNFRGASFSECDFSYSHFMYTHVAYGDLFNQLPPRPNVRRELARTLRMNAHNLGDAEGLLDCFWYEMRQTEAYLREAASGDEEYYKSKYPGLMNRIRFRLLYWRHKLASFVWGHGESPIRVVRSGLLAVTALALGIVLCGPGAGGPEFLSAPVDSFRFAFKHAIFLMLNAPDAAFQPLSTGAMVVKAFASLSGYAVFGLAVATIVRRYVRR
jgi:hypothetical protein